MRLMQIIQAPGIGWVLIFPMLLLGLGACFWLVARPSPMATFWAKRLSYGPLIAGAVVAAFGIVEAFVFDVAGDPDVWTYLVVALLDTAVLSDLLRAFAYAASKCRVSPDEPNPAGTFEY